MSQPRHSYALARLQILYVLPQCFHNTDDLVTKDERQFGVGQLSFGYMQISATDPTGPDPHQHLVWPRLWSWDLP
jgi:hypothetical protein